MFRILVLVVLALVALRGIYLLNGAIRGVRQADASTGWPKVQGVVVRTEDSRHDTVYSTKAVVQYTAGDGKAYSTDLVTFGDTLNPFDRQAAGLQRIRYPDGGKVSVSYDPSEPNVAVLQPGRHSDAFWPIGVSLAYLLPVALCLMQVPAMGRAMERNIQSIKAFKDAALRAGPMDSGEVSIELPPGTGLPRPSFSFIAAAIAATVASFVCAGGVLLLASGLTKMYYGFASQSWSTTPGEVTANIGSSELLTRKALHNTVILPPSFLYQYDVAGIRHVNSARRFRSSPGTQTDQERANAPADLPVGTKVSVAYFPTDPDISTLEPGNDGEMFILPGVGLVVLLFALGIFFVGVPSFL